MFCMLCLCFRRCIKIYEEYHATMAGVVGAGGPGRQTSHQAVLDSIAQDNIRDNVESLTRRLQVEMLLTSAWWRKYNNFF